MKDPAGILVSTWLASASATIVAIAAATALARLPRFRMAGPRTVPDAPVTSSPEPTIPDEPARTPPRLGGWVAAAYLATLVAALLLHFVRSGGTSPWGDLARGVLSFWMLPILIAGIVLFGWWRGVRATSPSSR